MNRFAGLVGLFASALGASRVAFSDGLGGAPAAVGDERAERHLKTLDEMDFEIYSNQRWDLLKNVQADNMTTTYADGTSDTGLQNHMKKLEFQFMWAPDTKISTHPIRFGSGDYAVVTAPMSGTFTKPMPMPNGSTIPPTGKTFHITVVTIAHFDASDKVDHQWVFWDNDSFMKQIGVTG